MTSALSIPRSAGLGDRYIFAVLGWDELHSVGIVPNGTLIIY